MRGTPMTKSKMKKLIFSILAWIGLICVVGWSIFPTLFVFTSAFKDPNEIFDYPPTLIGTFSIKNFITLARDWPEFFSSLLNSAVVVIGSVILTLLVSCSAAFAYSRMRNRYVKFSGFFIVAVRMFPPIVITIPFYPNFSKLV